MAHLIAVVVCTRDRYELLAGCLATLVCQTLPEHRREIVVVDNGADAAARRRFIAAGGIPRGVRLVVQPSPGPLGAPPGGLAGGLSRARNAGVAATRADIVAFIDDDAVAEPDWLERMVAAFAAAPEAAVAGGKVTPIFAAPRPRWLAPWHEGFLSLLDLGPDARDLPAGEWLAGTNIAFRRPLLLAAGGFDEVLGRHPGTLLGNEQVALSDRLRAAGHTVRYAPNVHVRHVVPAERLSQAWVRRRIVWQAISDLLMGGGQGGWQQQDAGALWQPIGAFLARMPPECRNLVGLTRDLDDPDLACAQGAALAALVHLLAGHGGSLETALLRAA